MRRVGVALVALATVLLSLGPHGAAAAGACQRVRLPVAAAAGRVADLIVAGTYCIPSGWAAGPREMDVLNPGATYNSAYWDWPQDPSRFSFVARDLRAGRATFDYDRIGTGLSSHPPSSTINIQSDAFVLHQVVRWARGRADQVNLIGHSYGSMVAIQEAGTYHDIARLVVTGAVHAPAIGVGDLLSILLLHPAALDVQFIGHGLDLGYLTTDPGVRGALFYSSSGEAAVMAEDEINKDVYSSTALASLLTSFLLTPGLNRSSAITAAVLVMVGRQDGLFCTLPDALWCRTDQGLRALEAPYYLSARSLDAATVPNTGHALALHPSASESFARINEWIGATA
jgi:pimeloyl-ACP methyl ester carboxylesterase